MARWRSSSLDTTLGQQVRAGTASSRGALDVRGATPCGRRYAAVLSIDDPVAHQNDITEAARDHVLVRTRADSHLVRDQRRRDAAVRSGAHFIGTDFVDPKLAWLDLGPSTPARRNPITSEGGTARARVLEIERTPGAQLSAR